MWFVVSPLVNQKSLFQNNSRTLSLLTPFLGYISCELVIKSLITNDVKSISLVSMIRFLHHCGLKFYTLRQNILNLHALLLTW